MASSTIVLIIAIIFIILAVISFLCDIKRGELYIGTLLAVVFFVFSLCGFGISASERFYERVAETRNDINVEWYLDGQLIDKENVSPFQYSCTFNEDGTKVFMTYKVHE